MTNHDPESYDPDLIDRLIDESSLGSPHAVETQQQISPDDVMAIRDQIFLDTRARQCLAESATVVTELGTVIPNADGSVDTRSIHRPDGSIVVATSRDEHREIAPEEPIQLPGRAERAFWKLYAISAEAHRCQLNGLIRLRRSDKGTAWQYMWHYEVALVWQVQDRIKAIKYKAYVKDWLANVCRDGIQREIATWTDTKLTVSALGRIERSVEQLLDNHGVVAECAVRLRGSKVKPAPVKPGPEAQQQPPIGSPRSTHRDSRVKMMRAAMAAYRLVDYELPPKLVEIFDKAPPNRRTEVVRRFVQQHYSPLIEALRVSGATVDDAVKAASNVFSVAARVLLDLFPERRGLAGVGAGYELGEAFLDSFLDTLISQALVRTGLSADPLISPPPQPRGAGGIRGLRGIAGEIYDRFVSGATVEEIAEDFDLPPQEVDAIVRALLLKQQESRFQFQFQDAY